MWAGLLMGAVIRLKLWLRHDPHGWLRVESAVAHGPRHLKFWVAGFFFVCGGASYLALVKRWDLLTLERNLDTMFDETKVGTQFFMPQVLNGWGSTLLVSFAILLVWYFVRYNESTGKFAVL